MFFTKGDVKTSTLEDYNSHNTSRLDIKQIKEKLLAIKFIKDQLQ